MKVRPLERHRADVAKDTIDRGQRDGCGRGDLDTDRLALARAVDDEARRGDDRPRTPVLWQPRKIEVRGESASLTEGHFEVGLAHRSAIDGIGGDNDEKLGLCVRFQDNFPTPATKAAFRDPAARYTIGPDALSDAKRTTKVDLGEAPVDHSYEQVGAELEFPVPPIRPFTTSQW